MTDCKPYSSSSPQANENVKSLDSSKVKLNDQTLFSDITPLAAKIIDWKLDLDGR